MSRPKEVPRVSRDSVGGDVTVLNTFGQPGAYPSFWWCGVGTDTRSPGRTEVGDHGLHCWAGRSRRWTQVQGIYIVIFVNLLLRIIQLSKQSTHPIPRGYFWEENETSTCHHPQQKCGGSNVRGRSMSSACVELGPGMVTFPMPRGPGQRCPWGAGPVRGSPLPVACPSVDLWRCTQMAECKEPDRVGRARRWAAAAGGLQAESDQLGS